MKKLLVLLMLGVGLSACNNNSKSADEIKADLVKQIPGIGKIDAVNKSPVEGVSEVVIGRKIFYVTNDGKYLFFGNLIDAVNKKSLTEQRTQELSKIDPKLLPLDLAIKEVNGTGKRVLYVFSDPECPYCQMFEKQIVPKLTDTTIYTFLFPLPMHAQAKPDSQKIWCSADKTKAWTDWMRNKVALPSNTNCDTSGLDKIYKLGTDVVQVEGTPTLILSNGQILPGAMPPDQLLQKMDEIDGVKPASAAASAPVEASAPAASAGK
ncbi:MAG: thiol:disulfide interchange protein [Burkholderiales bacterium]|jgi:thiol:disulfide interchange protein DsbC|nr:thiol:disulfide interchange protein [Burkholderiales bacterium]